MTLLNYLVVNRFGLNDAIESGHSRPQQVVVRNDAPGASPQVALYRICDANFGGNSVKDDQNRKLTVGTAIWTGVPAMSLV